MEKSSRLTEILETLGGVQKTKTGMGFEGFFNLEPVQIAEVLCEPSETSGPVVSFTNEPEPLPFWRICYVAGVSADGYLVVSDKMGSDSKLLDRAFEEYNVKDYKVLKEF